MVQREDARVRLGWPDVGPAELDEVAGVLESGMLTMGPKVPEFEAELARATAPCRMKSEIPWCTAR